MNADLNVPLSDEELDELDKFLMSDATNEEAMDISMLDGLPPLLNPLRKAPR
jgi:hypothetical protein